MAGVVGAESDRNFDWANPQPLCQVNELGTEQEPRLEHLVGQAAKQRTVDKDRSLRVAGPHAEDHSA